jgi:hypothetical protein
MRPQLIQLGNAGKPRAIGTNMINNNNNNQLQKINMSSQNPNYRSRIYNNGVFSNSMVKKVNGPHRPCGSCGK